MGEKDFYVANCPFCGDTASLQYSMTGLKFIQCDNGLCQARGGISNDYDIARNLWNKRVEGGLNR